MTQVRTLLTDLDPADRAELEHRLVAFDREWRVGALRVAIDRIPSDAPWRWAAVVEMVKIDLERNWRAGRRLSVGDYVREVPELGPVSVLPATLIAVEYQLRQELDGTSDTTEFLRRYPARADELRRLFTGTHDSTPDEKTRHTRPRVHRAAPAREELFRSGTFGRYRIIRLLGRGGMGAVYLAHDPQLQRDVALKIPSSALTAETEGVERMLQEARAAAGLRHPNICPVFDAGVIDDTPFITSLYVEGEPLSALAKRTPPVPQFEAAKLVATVARALQHAHAHGIIHRDLKPSNIMLDRTGQPIVTDFGLARRVRADSPTLATMSGLAGSPAYMAPEQIAETKAGPASDLFSLGIVLYELLAGRVPFEGTPEYVLQQLVERECPPPSQVRAGLDRRLEAVCLKALAKDPHDRYRSMGEFAAALGALRKPYRWRKPVLAAVGVLLVAGALAVGVAALGGGKPGSGQTQTPPQEGGTAGVRPVPNDPRPGGVALPVPKDGEFKPAYEAVRGLNGFNSALVKKFPEFKGTPQELIAALDDKDESTRYLAVLENARTNNKAAIPKLIERMRLPVGHGTPEVGERWSVRRECAAALAHLGKGNTTVEDALVARIEDALWEHGVKVDEKARWRHPFFGEKIYDPDHCGKAAALAALDKIAPDRVPEALTLAQKASRPEVRDWATRELKDRAAREIKK